MNKLWKIGVVVGGYVIAWLVASAAVAIRVACTSGPEAQASSGMYAFGDLVLFIAVFCTIGSVPTGLGLFFLRPYAKFWAGLAMAALTVAITGPVIVVVELLNSMLHLQGSVLGQIAALGFLRVLGAPLLAMTFFLCAVFAPAGRSRWALLVAGGLEVVVSTYLFIHLFVSRCP